MSICTGAFVLAAAGLLDGRPATTHWAYAERFRRLHARVELDPDVLFIDDGDVLTSAGVAAGIDLCLHVIRLDHGSEVANRAARRCVVPPWRDGGQAQYIERPGAEGHRHAAPRPTREWARQRLHEPLDAARPGRAAPDERAHLHPALPGGDRAEPGPVAAPAAHRPRPAAAGDDRPRRRPDRPTAPASAPPPPYASSSHQRIGVAPITYRRTFRPRPEPDQNLTRRHAAPPRAAAILHLLC